MRRDPDSGYFTSFRRINLVRGVWRLEAVERTDTTPPFRHSHPDPSKKGVRSACFATGTEDLKGHHTLSYSRLQNVRRHRSSTAYSCPLIHRERLVEVGRFNNDYYDGLGIYYS